MILATLLVLLAIGMTRIHNDRKEIRRIDHSLGVVYKCEQSMKFLELLFCGQSPHPTKYLGKAANATDAIFHCGPLSTWKYTTNFRTTCDICAALNFVSAVVDIKIFGQNSAVAKAVNADAIWRFSPETYFRAPARLKICSRLPPCHQNPLWKAHSCNLCRNDAENFPSKPFCWRARFTC